MTQVTSKHDFDDCYKKIIHCCEEMQLCAEKEDWESYYKLAQHRHALSTSLFERSNICENFELEKLVKKIDRYDHKVKVKLGKNQKKILAELRNLKLARKAVNIYKEN